MAFDGGTITITHSYAGGRPASRAAGGISVRMPWVIAQLHGRRRIVFSEIDELPAAATDMRRWAQAGGVHSHVAVPVVVGDDVLGGLHVAMLAGPRRWSEDDLRRLELLASAFAGALERRRQETPASERLADVERAHIREVLRCAGGKISGKGGAAERLGLHANTLRSRMQKLGLLRGRA